MHVTIDNDGQEIATTDYWQTTEAHDGLFYLSCLPGCVRLLVPSGGHADFAQLRKPSAIHLIQKPRGTIEILFEDSRSLRPFALILRPAQIDRPPQDDAPAVRFLAYVAPGLIAYEATCHLRHWPVTPI